MTPRPGVSGSTSQPALLRLPAYFRKIGQISRPTGVMHNAPHIPYPHALAIRCAVLFPLGPHDPSLYFPLPLLYPPKM